MKASEKILEQIRREQLRPKPRWHFVLKNALAWLAFAVAVILGGLAFSVILFAIQQTEFELLDHLNHSGIELFLGLLPLIWLVPKQQKDIPALDCEPGGTAHAYLCPTYKT